jgi:hypothetical protein
MTRTKLD